MGWFEDTGNWLFGQNSLFHSLTTGIGNVWNDITGVNEQNRMAKDAAQTMMDFQERLSNTSHQRDVADLKAAGINPILGASTGGASTPTGASYVPQRANPIEGVAKVLAMTQGAIDMALQTKQTNASVANLQADSDLKRSNALLSAAQTASVTAQSAKSKMTEPLYDTGTSLINALIKEVKKGYINNNVPKKIDDSVSNGISTAKDIMKKIGLKDNGKGGFKFKRSPKDIYGGIE